MTDSIIIKSNILMHPDDEYVLRKRILSQMQEGVVTLPPYCEIVYPEYKVIEQIRAEIEQSRYGLVNDGLDLALKIIDKYMK